ncbi:sensor histidine kinase [Flavitalea sp.]|nr:HAMP domain-containing sensor histidine kinase [Flavitalea sp.]
MKKLLNRSLKQFMTYAGIVLLISVPAYYIIISRLWQYELDEHNIVLTDAAGREDTFLIIGAVTLLTVVFFTLMLGGFILLNRRISRRLWQPFYQSLEKIKNFRLDQQHRIHFEKPDILEFSELNQSLDRLITGNIDVFKQQKEFAENASHELQTPLAVIQSKLELLMQSTTMNDKQYDIIEDAFKALARVSRINKNLLLLTKIEGSQYLDKEKVDLSLLVVNTVPLFLHFRDDKQINLIQEISPVVFVEGNKILIEIMLNNLITNAIRYGPVNQPIKIQLTDHMLTITNNGTKGLNPDKLFKRFATGASESPGTGLGLAIVKQICQRYGWIIKYRFLDQSHIFSVCFNS